MTGEMCIGLASGTNHLPPPCVSTNGLEQVQKRRMVRTVAAAPAATPVQPRIADLNGSQAQPSSSPRRRAGSPCGSPGSATYRSRCCAAPVLTALPAAPGPGAAGRHRRSTSPVLGWATFIVASTRPHGVARQPVSRPPGPSTERTGTGRRPSRSAPRSAPGGSRAAHSQAARPGPGPPVPGPRGSGCPSGSRCWPAAR